MRCFSQIGALPVPFLALLLSTAAAQRFYGGLIVETTKKVECTRHTKAGDKLSMNYRGTLQSDGTEFDSSYSRNEPFHFKLGAHQVIQGWDQGLVGMCIGEERKLTIPPEMAYGDRNMGKIPPGSTLIFETELVGIEGVEKEDDTGAVFAEEAPKDEETPAQGSEKGPKDGSEGEGECQLLGPFALLIQGALGILALTSLVWKRYRESPRRPLKVWAFDVSKQVVGSMMLHVLNLLMSMLSSGDFDMAAKASTTATAGFVQDDRQERPNPCSFYLLNLAIDTTIGIPILVFLLRILHALFAYTPLANPEGSLRSGNYGHPPKTSWWLKQSFIYFIGLVGMKFCVWLLFQFFPWIGWIGDWALKWTEGKAWLQITFVMLIFPLIMNGLQYYIIDSFIKDPAGEYEALPDQQHGDGEHEGLMAVNSRDSSDGNRLGQETGVVGARTKEANPTPLPVELDSDEEGERIGSSSREGTRKGMGI